jgi:hypothetical protein
MPSSSRKSLVRLLHPEIISLFLSIRRGHRIVRADGIHSVSQIRLLKVLQRLNALEIERSALSIHRVAAIVGRISIYSSTTN